MVNHWDRPGWSTDRQAFYWYLTFKDTELISLAQACQDGLRLPYLDPVPLDGLHLTLPKIGWTDQVSTKQVNQVFTTAAQQCADLKPFRLTVGPLAGSPGAVRLSVSPWEPIVALSRRLRSSIAIALGTDRVEPAFRPHIGVAYCNTPVPSKHLVGEVEKLRTLPPVDVTVSEVELVKLRRESGNYLWSTVGSISFR